MWHDACVLKGIDGKPCDGPMDRAHWVPKQAIKRDVSRDPEIVWHPAIWSWMCRWHHGQLDAGQIKVDREQLPHGVEMYAETFKLGHRLDRMYGPVSDGQTEEG